MKTLRLGVFIVGTLAILFAGVFLIGSRKLSFRSTYNLKAEFQNAGGLVDGAGVRVGGIHMGTVRGIQLPQTPDGKVTVTMELDDKTRAVVKKDSVASIQTEGLLGDEYVDVSFGSKDAPAIQNGDTIASQPPLEMSDLLKKADSLLDEAAQTAKNLEGISGKINNGTGTVGALINDRSLYNKVNSDAEALKHNFLLRGFFKNRGYEDASELTQNEISNLPAGPPAKDFTLNDKELFEKADNARLKDEKKLKPAGEFLQDNKFGLAVVVGLGSQKGDTSQEQKLTLARAAVVREYLVKNFKVDDTRIKTMGLAKQAQTPSGELEIKIYPAAPAGR